MPTFAYKARRPGTQILTDVIEADNQREAVARLKQKGYFLLSVEPARGQDGGSGFYCLRGISREEVAVFTSQLACLLRAGLPLTSALKSLKQQMKGMPLADVVGRIGRDVSESATLSESMAKFPKLFPRTYTAAIRSGEESGMLAEVMHRLSDNLKKEIEVRGRIRGALAYPIFLCALGAITLIVLMTFVIPRFTKLFATMGEQLPLLTRILLGFSDVMDQYWPIVLLAMAMCAGCTILSFKREATRAVIDRWVLVLPCVGSIIARSEIARFSRTLSELLASGVPILSGLRITEGVMTNRCFAGSIDSIRSDVAKGQAVATSLQNIDFFTPLVVNMIAVGEQSGQLPELLMEVAEIYEKECERAISAFTTILGPALIVVLGGIIAFVITAILLPVFQASTLAS